MKPYPEYKNTRIAWLDKIPAHWSEKRLRFVCNVNPSKSEIARLPKDTEVSFLPMEKISDEGSIILDETRSLEDVWQGYTYFRDDDVVVAKITPCFENGKGARCCGLTNGIGFGTTELHVLRAHEDILPDFLYLLSISHPFRSLGVSEMKGVAGQQRVPEDFIKDFLAAIPSLEEQRAIVDFAYLEMERIRQLITKKERLIDLLQEKRTALISQAVTKGLDPNVPMKDSGVEWLGEIPAHWRLFPFRRGIAFLTDFEANGSFATLKEGVNIDIGEPYAWYVRATDLENERYGIVEGNRYCDKESYIFLSKTKLYGGELLVTKRGEIGKTYIMPAIKTPATLGPNLYLIRLNDTLIPLYAHYWFMSVYGNIQLKSSNTSTTIGALYKDDIKDCYCLLPPVSEQIQICKYLKEKTNELDNLIAKIRQSIRLLDEYRSSIIASVVTGKADVSMA